MPEIDAVTEPICEIPAPIVTVPAPIVTTPMRFVPAGRAEPMVTVPEITRGTEPASLEPMASCEVLYNITGKGFPPPASPTA